jgi:hypothetical protein
VWHDKDPFLLKGPERRAYDKICSPIIAIGNDDSRQIAEKLLVRQTNKKKEKKNR